eukprot:SAG11_NODE_12713_length_689_cov_0.864407_1_plen_94_part_01
MPHLGLTELVEICRTCGGELCKEAEDLRAAVAETACFVDILPDKLSNMWLDMDTAVDNEGQAALEMQSASICYQHSAIWIYKVPAVGFGLHVSD